MFFSVFQDFFQKNNGKGKQKTGEGGKPAPPKKRPSPPISAAKRKTRRSGRTSAGPAVPPTDATADSAYLLSKNKKHPGAPGGSQGCKALFARFHLVFSLRLCRKPYSLTRKNGNAFACGSGVVFTADTVRNFHRHPLSRSARHRLLFPSSPFACIIARPPWFVKGGTCKFFHIVSRKPLPQMSLVLHIIIKVCLSSALMNFFS